MTDADGYRLLRAAALDGIVPLFGLLRKLALNKFLEEGRVSEFFEAAPV